MEGFFFISFSGVINDASVYCTKKKKKKNNRECKEVYQSFMLALSVITSRPIIPQTAQAVTHVHTKKNWRVGLGWVGIGTAFHFAQGVIHTHHPTL